jgi:hypothetical protein
MLVYASVLKLRRGARLGDVCEWLRWQQRRDPTTARLPPPVRFLQTE